MKKYDIYDIDKDALFDRINDAIDSIDTTAPDDTDFSAFDIPETETTRPRITFTKSFLTAAAAIIIMFAALPLLISINGNKIADSSRSAPETAAADEAAPEEYKDRSDDDLDEYCEDAAPEEESGPQELFFPASDGWEFSSVSISSAKSHAETDNWGILPYFNRANMYDSDHYRDPKSDSCLFSEESVLSETDFFLDCRIEEVTIDISEGSDNFDAFCEVTPIHVVSENDIMLPSRMTIRIGGNYLPVRGREYLIPVKINGSGYEAADKSSPQTEITEERLVIYHNGWKELGNSEHERLDLSEISESNPIAAEDYFYDRINITAETSLRELFDAYLYNK